MSIIKCPKCGSDKYHRIRGGDLEHTEEIIVCLECDNEYDTNDFFWMDMMF